MSGIYNYHPNIEHPGAFLNNQMNSYQEPFYFGGSQTPISLGFEQHTNLSHPLEGSGFKKTTHRLFRKDKMLIPTSALRK